MSSRDKVLRRWVWDATSTIISLPPRQSSSRLMRPWDFLCHDCVSRVRRRTTINAQPALLTTSYACLQAVRDMSSNGLPLAAFVTGHSLGEYTALAAAGVLDFATAVYLARERGRLM